VGVRAVVFDVGNVLVEWVPALLYEKLIPDDAAREAFLRDVVTRDWHFQHDAGRSFADTSAELIAEYPQHRALIEAWGDRFLDTIPRHVDGMPDLVAELAACGVPLYAITNFSGEFWRPFVKREAALFAPFRDIVVSGDERMMKPHPEIYRLALRRFGLGPGEGLFVDDSFANVRGAEREGFVGHHFVDADAVRSTLIGHGLL
jgi:2-haloacid dehalogenase